RRRPPRRGASRSARQELPRTSGVPEDRDPARGGMAADVVAERELGPLHLARPRLAAELEHVLVDHAHPGGAGRMPEALEPAVGVDGQLAAQLEDAARDVLLGRALGAEPEV